MPHQYEAVTIELRAPREFENPLRDPEVRMVFAAPSGKERRVWAFWNGGVQWLARTEASEVGRWTWRAEAPEDFEPTEGEFTVSEYDGDNALYRHGPIRVGGDGFRLVHADDTPFFWLADTAWNALIKARPEDWLFYLRTRIAQGMTATQCVMTQWRGFDAPDRDSLAFFGESDVRINPLFYQRMDPMFERANREGMLVAPVVLWANVAGDPGLGLPDEDRRAVARYVVARYGAYSVLWLLGGDAKYTEENIDGWRALGRRLFEEGEDRAATMHPCGESWTAPMFFGEPWYDVATWQSGHGDSEKTVEWLTRGPHVDAWREGEARPYIDLEPRYEAIRGYHKKEIHDAWSMRRGLWWNLLMKPTAGVTYGHHGIWPWAEHHEVPDGHGGCNESPTWREGLESEGAGQLIHIRRFMDDAPWHELMPAPEALVAQPGDEDPELTIAVAMTRDKALLAAYLPHGGEVTVKNGAMSGKGRSHWLNPRTGETLDIGKFSPESNATCAAPDEMDWVAVFRCD